MLNNEATTTVAITAQLPNAIIFAVFHARCGERFRIPRSQVARQARHRYLNVDIAIKFGRRRAALTACLRWLRGAVVHDRYSCIYQVISLGDILKNLKNMKNMKILKNSILKNQFLFCPSQPMQSIRD